MRGRVGKEGGIGCRMKGRGATKKKEGDQVLNELVSDRLLAPVTRNFPDFSERRSSPCCCLLEVSETC